MKKELKKIGDFLEAWGNMTTTSLAVFVFFLWIPWHAANALLEYFFLEPDGSFSLEPSWFSICVEILSFLAFFFGVWLLFSLILYVISVLGCSEEAEAAGRKEAESRDPETKP